MDAKPNSSSPEPVKADFIPEIEDTIPVKHPAGESGAPSDPVGNPIVGGSDINHSDADKVLDEVSNKVKAANAEQKPKRGLLGRFSKKSANGAQAQKPAGRSNKPLLIGVVAAVVAIGLSAAAYVAFSDDKQSEPEATSASDSSQQANQSSVTAGDLDTLSSDMQSEVDGLNEAQDFDSAALSDSALGL